MVILDMKNLVAFLRCFSGQFSASFLFALFSDIMYFIAYQLRVYLSVVELNF